MKTIALAFVVASTLLIPTISHANAALLRCMDRNGKLAEQILASNLIVVGTVDDVDENTTRKGDHWTATWTAKLRVQKTVHGTPPPKALSLSGQCSGLKNMSHNHCGQTPSKSDKATLIFLNKDKEGHYHLVSPPRHTGHGDECPDAKTVAKLEKKMPGLFAKVTKAQEELEKEAATAKLAAKDKELAAKNKELAAKNKELAT
ncbi:MAG: hypothetical protein KAI47_24660, partial [Deltaproteobacteria bacterium]|nr:hypothetical protein [Deltaproteobacteria bacterium]